MQVECFATTTTVSMARLSFGSQHFQANGRHSTLLTESAERVSSVPDSPKARTLVNDDSVSAMDNTVDTDHEDTSLSQCIPAPVEKTDELEASKLKLQIANISKFNDELIDENTALRDENKKLTEDLERLRKNLVAEQDTNAVDELESTVLSSFAKILKEVRKLKTADNKAVKDVGTPDCLALAPIKKEVTAEVPPCDSIGKSENDLAETKPADYSAFTFFKPLQNRKSLSKSSAVIKEDNNKLLKLQSPFSFTKRVSRQSDNSFNLEEKSSLQSRNMQQPGNDVLLEEDDAGKNIITSSTPRRNEKKSTITDIYGDEIPLRKKKDNIPKQTPKLSQESQAGVTPTYEQTPTATSMKETAEGRKVLSNITNKRRKRNYYKLQPASPVDKGFFDYVDESVLMEQTQQAVTHVKKRFETTDS